MTAPAVPSAPRWSSAGPGLSVHRDGKPFLTIIRPVESSIEVGALYAIRNRIVSLLNATELSSDAVATLQYACMSTAEHEKSLRDFVGGADTEESREQAPCIAALDNLTDVLNHAVRVYVELDPKPSIELDGSK